MSMWEQKLNGAQGRDRAVAYPIEIPSLFEWRLSSIPTSGPGAFFAAGRVRLCAAIPKSCACHALYKMIPASCGSPGREPRNPARDVGPEILVLRSEPTNEHRLLVPTTNA